MKKGFIQDRSIYEDKEIFAFNLYKSDYSHEFISKELLELSQIKLSRNVWNKKNLNKGIIGLTAETINDLDKLLINIPHNEEVYFDELLSTNCP